MSMFSDVCSVVGVWLVGESRFKVLEMINTLMLGLAIMYIWMMVEPPTPT